MLHFPVYDEMAVATHGKFLGVMVGPGAAEHQWAEVPAKAKARFNDVRLQGHSRAARANLHNCYMTPLCLTHKEGRAAARISSPLAVVSTGRSTPPPPSPEDTGPFPSSGAPLSTGTSRAWR